MRVRYSVLADASGSFGGLVASHNRAGQYLRTRVRPTNPSSPAQVQVRTIFANLATAWATLTDAQRDAWATYAINVPITGVFGEPLVLTGHQMFIRSNAVRLQVGLPRVDDGPTIFSAVEIPFLFPNANAAGPGIELFIFEEFPWTSEAGAALVVYNTRQQAGTVRYRRVPYRFASAAFGPLDPAGPQPFDSLSPFAFTDNGSNVVFGKYFVLRADGRMSIQRETGPLLIKTT